MLQTYLSLISRSALFQDIDIRDLPALLSCLEPVQKPILRGEILIAPGDKLKKAGLLLEGLIHIEQEDYWGNLSILNEITPGDIFGEVYGLLPTESIPHRVCAVKNGTLLYLDMQRLITTCHSSCHFHQKLLQNLLKVLAYKNRFLTGKLEHMSRRSTREKLLSYLSHASARAGSSTFTIPFNRQQLADYLSVDRSAMSAELSRMQKEGLLTYHKNQFALHKASY